MRAMTFLIVALCLCSGASTWSQQPQTEQHPATTPQGAHMEHRFDDPEKYAKSFDDPARDEWQKPVEVISALALTPGQVVADIGAGTGYFTVRLAKAAAAPKVYAVDVEKSMVDYISHRATKEGLRNISAILARPDHANLPEPVDLVLVVDTYHHIPNRPAYFRELRKSLKPAARVAIIDFRKGAPSGPPEEFRVTPEQISAEMKQAGFVLQVEHDFLPRQIYLVYGTSR
jgi:ubiquinone/menaquinone biosynthesis C-methylase UbiE